MQFLGEIKKQMFPTITDWKRDYPEYKHAKDWLKLPDLVFIFFNLKGTRIAFYPTALIALLIFGGLLYYSYLLNNIAFIITLLITIGIIRPIYKIHKLVRKGFTLYEIFLKENA